MKSRALIVIDMQAGSFTGEPPRHEGDAVIARINALADAFRANGGLVVFIQHTAERDGYARGSEAWQLVPGLRREPEDLSVEKLACDAFLGTTLRRELDTRGVREVFIVGCATDFCVDTTVRAAGSLGYEVCAVADAHTTRDRPHLTAIAVIQHHNWMWDNLLLPERKVRVLSTQQVLAELKIAAVVN